MFKLPDRMEEIWFSIAKGEREIEVATRLNITRQAVNKAVKEARAKITSMFLELAESLSLDIIRVNAEKGYMVARSRQLGLRVYAFYVPRRGVCVIFGMKPYCQGLENVCKAIVNTSKSLGLIHKDTRDLEIMINEIIKKVEE